MLLLVQAFEALQFGALSDYKSGQEGLQKRGKKITNRGKRDHREVHLLATFKTYVLV